MKPNEDLSAHFLAAELSPDIATIDLHGDGGIQDALDHLERDLYLFFSRGETFCRVVTGIGTGAMARAVIDALEKNPMIGGIQKEESGGSFLVLF